MLTSRTAPLPISTFADLTHIFLLHLSAVLIGCCPGSRSTIFTTLHPYLSKSSSGPAVEHVGGWSKRLQEHFEEQIYGSSPFIIEGPEYLQRRSSVNEGGGKGLVRGPASKVSSGGLLNWIFTWGGLCICIYAGVRFGDGDYGALTTCLPTGTVHLWYHMGLASPSD